jgi:3-isopropylmalate/(R)-2-methylmalate dehydratase small subunit
MFDSFLVLSPGYERSLREGTGGEIIMQPFVTHRGRVALLDWSDVNTDLIIPARYLKKIERTGYGPLLFADKRYVAGGAPAADAPTVHGGELPDFPLNNLAYRGATVLLVGHNFGCGSSREHAVWAVMQAGYRALIAPGKDAGFADIFEANAFQNGLLVIELTDDDWQSIARAARSSGGAEVTIDLRDQTVTLEQAPSGSGAGPSARFSFMIPESHRQRLLHGQDAIARTLRHDPAINRYEHRLPAWIGAVSGG